MNTNNNKVFPYGRQIINANDIAAVCKVLTSDFLTQGPSVTRFENSLAQFVGCRYAVVFSSGTAALHAACFTAGIGTEDEVITTPMTFAASANCVLYCGGKPVFVDIQKDIPLIDPLEIEKKITSRTKAIIPVDYAGIPADYKEITKIARKHKLLIIADAAHSLGAIYKGKRVGVLADMTMFSFHPVKLITTGEGGAIVTNSKTYYQKLVQFRTHGITKKEEFLTQKKEGSWYYEMQTLGYNYRMTDIQAALGLSQLKKASVFLEARQQLANTYFKAFQNNTSIQTLTVPYDRTSAWHLFPIQVPRKKRQEIFNTLHSSGIKVQVHYIPLHLHPYYLKQFGYKKGDFPNAERFYQQEISLPIYPTLKKSEAQWIAKKTIEIVKRFINN